MSAIHLDNRLAHYEIVGRRGQPIIFLHSWLGSWRYWLPTMEHLSDRYRTYALDFWGFGESDRRGSEYSLDGFVAMLLQFIETLGLSRVNLVGHGLGGMVAVRAAGQRPDLFPRLTIVTTPLYGAQVQAAFRGGGLSRLLGRPNPTNAWARLARDMKIDDHQIHREIIEDTDGLSEAVVEQVGAAIMQADLREDLGRLRVPLLGIYGQRDMIVGPEQAALLREDHPTFQQPLCLPKSSHFPFLDQPNVFNRALTDFLASDLTDQVRVKHEWRRRVSQLEYI